MFFSISTNNRTMEKDCDLMDELAQSYALRASLIINLIISLCAVPILTKAYSFISRRKLFHHNTRIQIKLHLIAILIHITGRCFQHIMDLGNYLSNYKSGCEAMPNFYRCLISRGLYNIGIALCPMASIVLVIERLLATTFTRSYENCPKKVGYFLAAIQILFCFLFLLKLYYNAPFTAGTVVLYYCQTFASVSYSPWAINAPLYTVMVSQVVARILFQVILNKNQKMRSNLLFSTLSSRYNLEQSIRCVRILKVFVNITSCTFFFFSVISTTLHFNVSRLSKPNYFAVVEVLQCVPLYGIILCYICYRSLNKVDEKLRNSLNYKMTVSTEFYFQQFNNQLNK